MNRSLIPSIIVIAILSVGLLTEGCDSQNDGNPTEEVVEFGRPIAGLTDEQQNLFNEGLAEFTRVRTAETGLGPVFNERSCAACHRDPAIGGNNDDLSIIQTLFGTETNNSFDELKSAGGDLLQTRGIGEEIEGCPLGEVIPEEATIVAIRQVPPLFGAGLIEAIPEEVIMANEDPDDLDGDGISGRAHMSLFYRRITRFGVKADIPDLDSFTGTALVREMGVTNPHDVILTISEQLPQGQQITDGCDLVQGLEASSEELEALAAFQRFLGPPPRGEMTEAVIDGEAIFEEIGCSKCHIDRLATGASEIEALSDKSVELYSDLLLHDMGAELADGVEKGPARGYEFRTTPLWGLRARNFYLHDGRTNSLEEAILLHGGEAETVIDRFLSLTQEELDSLMAFLNSL
jgi:CxxC motif-containing protein (DUF1111 family)